MLVTNQNYMQKDSVSTFQFCCVSACGSHGLADGVAARLVGGDGATNGQWPSVALLYHTRYKSSCTTSIISPKWLLSSYSCLHLRYIVNIRCRIWCCHRAAAKTFDVVTELLQKCLVLSQSCCKNVWCCHRAVAKTFGVVTELLQKRLMLSQSCCKNVWCCHRAVAKNIWCCHRAVAKNVWCCHRAVAKNIWCCHRAVAKTFDVVTELLQKRLMLSQSCCKNVWCCHRAVAKTFDVVTELLQKTFDVVTELL